MFVRLLTTAEARNGNQLVPRRPDRSAISEDTPITFVLKRSLYEPEWNLPSAFVTHVCDKGRATAVKPSMRNTAVGLRVITACSQQLSFGRPLL